MKIGVITYPGTLDDRDAQRAVRLAGGTPVPLWHADSDIKKVDAVVLPGGFSYGDYLRCGAIAAQAPATQEVVRLAAQGLPVLGICNGFQVLVESRLLPGGLIRNEHQHFICRDQRLRVENTNTAWTNLFEQDEEITIPLKNAEGGYIASADTIKMLEAENRVVFRYLDVNPNGSMNDIAGLTNERGNVVGLMPHPEHATEPGFGPDTDIATRSGVDGLKFFQSVLKALVNS
jgi:phosphoribosylformylglycinamidine synthase subunit PurQ / glutaminase